MTLKDKHIDILYVVLFILLGVILLLLEAYGAQLLWWLLHPKGEIKNIQIA